ncbi:S9 family peptidase [Sphingomonas sp. CFBP 13720]|uniref:S9 family peptidase n=1 Tax=Sphingomonas sp. CFBP 13720 TaxID=2775302 RepID=UPI00177F9D61|nr:prolyl oligopeptidase family serine peptidase [Sphingomonas sp. CFBP 13720]MBD8680123.1 S9 family peptidase [Sphingomonas sp. CFBP 13720]
MLRSISLFAVLPFWILASVVSQASAQTEIAGRLERARQVAGWPELIRDSLVTPRWLPQGERLIVWNAVGSAAGTWTMVEAATGEHKTLISHAVLCARLTELTGKTAALPMQMPFELTYDNRGLLFRYDGEGYRLDIATGAVRHVEDGAIDALMLAGGQLSPQGDRLAVQDGDGFAVIDARGKRVFARTGETDLAWILPDQAWSPDGRIAVWQVDQREVHHIPIVDYASSTERVSLVPYAKVGTPIARSVLYLFDPGSGSVAPVQVAPDEGYYWLAGWHRDDSALVLRMARDGKQLDLLAIARDGMVRRLLREERRDTKVVDLNFAATGWAAQVTQLPQKSGFLWMSDRDGWRHVYQYDDDGRLIAQRTRGAFSVARIDHVAADGGLLVTASTDPANPYDELLYSVGPVARDWYAVATEPGVHGAQPSPSGRYLIDSRSSWTNPRVRDLRRVDGTVVTRLTTADARAVQTTPRTPLEPITVLAADGSTSLHGALFRPYGFDPAKRYPVVAYIYGGPFGTVLSRTFTGNTMMRRAEALAAAGFVVIAVDVRGSAGRSKAFGDATYGRIGQSEIADYVTALRQTASTRPWMDFTRVGIHGHSWGGYFAIRAMLTAPDVFKAGYAGAPGALDEDALVNEPNMGLRESNPSGYAAGSNLLLADRLKGSLRIMHGTADVNAPLSSTMRLVQALMRADKPVDLLLMPGVGHDPDGRDEDTYREDVVRYFSEQLQ